MPLEVSTNAKWSWPIGRIVVGLGLVAVSAASFSFGEAEWTTWVILGLGIASLGSAFASVTSVVPRWVVYRMAASEDGIRIYEHGHRDTSEKRMFDVPARIIKGTRVTPIRGGERVDIETVFGMIPWKSDRPATKDAVELRALWKSVDYDTARPWLEPAETDAIEVGEGQITWQVEPRFSLLGSMIVTAGLAVAAWPLFGVWAGIPFALIGAALLFFLGYTLRRYRELFGYSARVWVDEELLRYDAGAVSRFEMLGDITSVSKSFGKMGSIWVAEVRGSATDPPSEAELEAAPKLINNGWFMLMPDHGALELILLIEAVRDLIEERQDGPLGA